MPDTPETAARDAAESSSPQQAEVWTERSPRTSQKPLPAYTTLNDRVRQGDTLVRKGLKWRETWVSLHLEPRRDDA